MSTSLNSMTGVIWEDLIRPNLRHPVSENRASQILKVLVVVIGALCVGLVFVVERMGAALVQASKMLSGITAGTLLGVFSLGMFFPWANAKGALAGGLASFALVAWMSLGTQAAMARGDLRFPGKPVTLDGCPDFVLSAANVSLGVAPTTDLPDPHLVFPLYRLSYLWYTAVGAFTAVVVGLVVSFLTGPLNPKTVDRSLLAPAIHRFLPDEGDRAKGIQASLVSGKVTMLPVILLPTLIFITSGSISAIILFQNGRVADPKVELKNLSTK